MDLDSVLRDLGQFGKFQAYYFTLLLFPVLLTGFRSTEYIFTTLVIPHRCLVPECDVSPPEWRPRWIENAVPFDQNNEPAQCLRYRHIAPNGTDGPTTTSPNGVGSTAPDGTDGSCPTNVFANSTQTCDRFVFSEPIITIANGFGILCPSEQWLLTLLSSLPVITSFIGIPLAGLLSDRVGRKRVLVWGSVLLPITGVLRSFSPSYAILAVLEVADGLLGGSIYAPAFLLGLETLAPGKRLLGSLFINVYFVVGEIVLALIMWATGDWRTALRVFYVPLLAMVSLHWLLPESVRWLHTKSRNEDVVRVLTKIAKMNKTEDKLPIVLDSLKNSESSLNISDKAPSEKDKEGSYVKNELGGLRAAVHSRVIMWRLFACSLCWIASIFGFYGISQNSVYVQGSRYMSFLLVSLVELPAYVLTLWLPRLPALGRRGSTAGAFFLCAASCIALNFVRPDQQLVGVTLFLLGKMGATFTITVLYLYTAEIFPTEVRHSLLSACSMVGRVGSVLSQQMPLVAAFVNPALVFGAVSAVGGCLALTCPETLETVLPDTVQQAEAIGRRRAEHADSSSRTPTLQRSSH